MWCRLLPFTGCRLVSSGLVRQEKFESERVRTGSKEFDWVRI